MKEKEKEKEREKEEAILEVETILVAEFNNHLKRSNSVSSIQEFEIDHCSGYTSPRKAYHGLLGGSGSKSGSKSGSGTGTGGTTSPSYSWPNTGQKSPSYTRVDPNLELKNSQLMEKQKEQEKQIAELKKLVESLTMSATSASGELEKILSPKKQND